MTQRLTNEQTALSDELYFFSGFVVYGLFHPCVLNPALLINRLYRRSKLHTSANALHSAATALDASFFGKAIITTHKQVAFDLLERIQYYTY
jgi:hypothetical protein